MKLNIRQRVFRLVLSASVLTFPVLASVLLIGIISIRYTLEEKSEALSKYSVDYTEQVVTYGGFKELLYSRGDFIIKAPGFHGRLH